MYLYFIIRPRRHKAILLLARFQETFEGLHLTEVFFYSFRVPKRQENCMQRYLRFLAKTFDNGYK